MSVTSLMASGKAGDSEMGTFQNTFSSFAERTCDPAKWQKYFAEYDADIWDAEGDGLLQFHSDDGKEYSLVIVHWRDFGFLLQLACRNLETNRSEWCKFSMSDQSLLDQFEERDDLTYPIGCFLSPSAAWLSVEDFLNRPTEPSDRTQWIDDGNIDWPF